MPITPFLNGEHFDPETTRVLGVALEMVCIALRTGDCDDDIKQAIPASDLVGKTDLEVRELYANSADHRGAVPTGF
jgi:hypothetical protein